MSEANQRLSPDYVNALSRSLYWAYSKATTGEPKPWRELTPEDRKLWATMARRAIRGIENLDAQGTSADETGVEGSAPPQSGSNAEASPSPALIADVKKSAPPAPGPKAKKRAPIRSQLEWLLGSGR